MVTRGIGMKFLLFASVFSLLCSFAVYSLQPSGPDTTQIREVGRHTNGTDMISGTLHQASAGNVTELVMSQTRSTLSWQGYTGNVTGTITLDDGNNNTLYDWKLNTPTGQVFASNATPIQWPSIACINFSSNISSDSHNGRGYNLTKLNQGFGINETDLDSFNNTFNSTFSGNIRIGGITIAVNNSCPQAFTYVDEASQTTSFKEILLTDNTSVIFTAILENDVDGYKTGADQWDFQMLVAQNGHAGFETTTTNYFFFLQLA